MKKKEIIENLLIGSCLAIIIIVVIIL